MSRVTALLGGKRHKGDTSISAKNKDESNGHPLVLTPEKDKHASGEVRRARESSFTESIGGTGSADRTSVIRRQPSNGSMILHSTTPDGTPIVYGSTTDENASRSGRLTADDGSANGKNRRSTFSRGGPALDLPKIVTMENGNSNGIDEPASNQYATRGIPAFQPVGEGSLSLDTLLGPSNQDALTPKAGYLPFPHRGPEPRRQPTLFVTDASPLPSPVPGSEEHRYRRPSAAGSTYQKHPPVFEHSDLEHSSSDSTASRSDIVQHTQHSEETASGRPSSQGHSMEDHRGRSMTTIQSSSSLGLPLASDSHGSASTRGRASTSAASSMPSERRSVSPSPARSATTPVKSSKSSKKNSNGSNGIASALALSGVAFASPAPGVAHPFQLARKSPAPLQVQRTGPERKRTGSSGAMTSPANGSLYSDGQYEHGHPDGMVLQRKSTEEGDGFESPTPLSNYTPNDSPRYEDDPAFHAMVSMDVLGDFDDVVTQIGTGYALASSKRNAEFHALFKTVPEDDFLIEGTFPLCNSPSKLMHIYNRFADYGCALQREILIQGRLYISEHRLCFYANIFGWVTSLTLDFHEIIAIEKRNTALVIPNAVLIATMHNRNTFASFISRDMTYDLIVSLWRNSHPVVPASAALPDSADIIEDDDDEFAQSHNEEHTGNEADTGRKKRKMRKGRFKKMKGGNRQNSTIEGEGEGENTRGLEPPAAPKGRASLGNTSIKPAATVQHPPTTCNCATTGTGHFANTVMDATFPGSPEKLYNLMFTSGFMKDFLTQDMKLTGKS